MRIKYTKSELYLFNYYYLERYINNLKRDLEKAVEEANHDRESMLAPTLRVVKVKTNNISDPVLDTVIKIMDKHDIKIKKLTNEINVKEAERDSIETLVKNAGLNDVEYAYIKIRYFKCKQAWKSAQLIGYSETQAKRYRLSALIKIKNQLLKVASDADQSEATNSKSKILS